MLDFNEICINDKALFDKYLLEAKPQISEMTFTNLFMWRNSYKFRFAEIEGLLCIISVPDTGEPFAFMPLGKKNPESLAKAVEKLSEYFKKNGWKLRFERVCEEDLDYMESLGDYAVSYEFDRDSSDYIYRTSDLIELRGKKYDGKRNHINKFKKLYGYEYEKIDNTNIEACYRIMENWCNERELSDYSDFYCEKIANSELLKNYGFLGCRGALIKVDGRFEAFTVADMLNEDTAVIHIEKANSKINGLYTFINQQFCSNEFKDTLYINREQDLGIEGLRKAKLSYNPYRLVNKYSVNLVKL